MAKTIYGVTKATAKNDNGLPKGEPRATQSDSDRALARECIEQYTRDQSNLAPIRDTWDEKEAMLLGSLTDSYSSNVTKSQVFDPRLSTIVWERAARVMAQPPTGKAQALSRHDAGKNAFMNLLLQKYVIPNASTQYDFITKTKLWDVYSNVYGTFGTLVDYHVRDDYTGPDFTLIPVRDIIPQAGKVSVQDCDRLFIRSTVSRKWLLSRSSKNWKNIDRLLEKIPSHSPSRDLDNDSYIDRKFGREDFVSAEKDDFDQVELITRYEKDRWVTFSKDASLILRDCDNYHENGKIPVVVKYAFPLLDRFFGLGEFERGKSLQFAINSLINLYLDGVKRSIFPPLKIYLPDVVARTITNEAGAKWVLKNNNPNAITEAQFSPQGIQTFQSTYQFLLAALLNQAGTTDTTVPQEADMTQGKTPQALRMVAARENARDNWDRFMMEKALEQTFDLFIDVLTHRQEKPIKLHLMAQDLALIQSINPDAAEMFESGEYGEVTIKPTDIKNTNYKFFIDGGSTMKKDEQLENQSLTEIIGLVMKMPGAPEQIMATGKVALGAKSIDFGETFKRWIITSGVQDWDKIVTDMSEEELAMQADKAMQGIGPNGLPLQGAQPPMGAPGMPPGGAQMPVGGPPPAGAAPDMGNFETNGLGPQFAGGQMEMSPEAQQIMQELYGG